MNQGFPMHWILIGCAIFTILFMLFFMRKYILGIFYAISGGYRIDKNAKTTPEQYRKLLVGAIYGVQQTAYMNTLTTGASRTEEIVTEWWGITNREKAINKLNYLATDGFRSAFPVVYKAFLEEDEQMQKDILTNGLVPNRELTPEEQESVRSSLQKAYTQMLNLKESYNELKKLNIIASKEDILQYGISAWDFGRLSFLSRLCYDMKYISEQEAWEYIDIAYQQSKTHSNSWDAFGKSYIIGRALWGGNDVANDGITIFVEELLTKKDSPWKKVAW